MYLILAHVGNTISVPEILFDEHMKDEEAFLRRGKMLLSHCPVRPGRCSECEKVVSKKGEPKTGTERKKMNRCNRYTFIEKDAVYEYTSAEVE